MDALWQQIALIVALVLLNALFAGAELALVSLRESQLRRFAARGGAGKTLAELARDPNRFLATIQIVITLSGFFASASGAVTLAGPLADALGFLGNAAYPVAVVVVTLLIAYFTLVVGELAPKRLAMQRAERWGLLVARPLAFISRVTRPVVWLLSESADLVVRLLGGDPRKRGQEMTEEEVRDIVANLQSFSPEQRLIISGAFDISERSLRQILTPRRDVFVLDEDEAVDEALARLIEAGFSRAPTAPEADLDRVTGVVHIRDLIAGRGRVADVAHPPLVFPESVEALDALREMRQRREHLAVVVNEHGSSEGIVTIEDLLEELVGEIYDESDRDVVRVVRRPDGSLDVPGSFPIHDLVDIGVDLPEGDYTTVAGLILDALGRVPDEPGDVVTIDRWEATVLAVADRAITLVRLRRVDDH
ncbi:MAG TPA: hemolysin family protein [Acidimicrobiia bacterium]|nr:hemolysin family protein [Acidimicrobiia bacterium]